MVCVSFQSRLQRIVKVLCSNPNRAKSGWQLCPFCGRNPTLSFPTEQLLAVRPEAAGWVHVAIERLPTDAQLDA